MKKVIKSEICKERPNAVALGAFNASLGRGKGADGKSPDASKSEDITIDKSFHIRDTFVNKDIFNSLDNDTKKQILAIKKEQDDSGYIDARTSIGPDQARRMSDRQRDRISNAALDTFARERKVVELLKTKAEKYAEKKADLKERLRTRLLQLRNEEGYFKEGGALYRRFSTPRENSTKKYYRQVMRELAATEKALNKIK